MCVLMCSVSFLTGHNYCTCTENRVVCRVGYIYSLLYRNCIEIAVDFDALSLGTHTVCVFVNNYLYNRIDFPAFIQVIISYGQYNNY